MLVIEWTDLIVNKDDEGTLLAEDCFTVGDDVGAIVWGYRRRVDAEIAMKFLNSLDGEYEWKESSPLAASLLESGVSILDLKEQVLNAGSK